MKTTLILLATLLSVAATSFAQDFDGQRVKILPTDRPGFIKLHCATQINKPVELTFFDENRKIVGRDVIRTNAPNGISKRYNVRYIFEEAYWVQIKSGKEAVVYHIVPRIHKRSFTAVLQPASDQFLVQANN